MRRDEALNPSTAGEWEKAGDRQTHKENQPLITKCQSEMGQDRVGAARGTQAPFIESKGGKSVQISGERGRISSFISDRCEWRQAWRMETA